MNDTLHRRGRPAPIALPALLASVLIAGLVAAPGARAADCAIAQAELATRLAGEALNHCPQADAGLDLPVRLDQPAVLDGTRATDADGDRLQYRWSLVSAPTGSRVTIDAPDAVRTQFNPDLAGDYVFELTVTDALGATSTDTVRYSTGNVAPVANAGDDLAARVGEWVTLSAQRSFDPDADPVKYGWRLLEAPAGSSAALRADLADTELFVDVAGTYVAELIVSDGATESVADTVRISTLNSIPLANAGNDRRYAPGSTVQLSGERSLDADGDALSYRWSLLSGPAGAEAALDGQLDQISPRAYLTEVGLYVFQLGVDDGVYASAADTVTIEVVNDRLENVDPKDYRHMVSRGGGDDTDGDGVLDLDDNCVLDSNAAQRDTDGDGIGNRCDPDLNNDGIVNAIDLGLFKAVFFTTDPDADFDGNGIVNAIDLGIFKSRFFLPPGPAGLIIWVSLVDGDWANRENWQPQIVPAAGSAALINVGTDVVVTSTGDTATFKTLTNEETLALSSSTFEATGSIENGNVVNLASSTLNNTLIEPSMSGSGIVNIVSGTNTWNGVTLNVDAAFSNGAIVNSNNSLTINSDVTVNAPSSPTGFQFVNSQTLSGTGTIELNGVGNGQVTEPRLLPFNSTTLSVNSGITVRGGKGTIGNPFATIVFNGSLNADVGGETLVLSGSMSGSGSLNASNGGAIQISGNYDNAIGAPVAVDAAGGSIALVSGTALRNLSFNAQVGTNLTVPGGTYTFQNIDMNSDLTLANSALIGVTDGMTLDGTATVNAPSSPTGFQFTNDQTLDGAGTIVFNGTGNGVVSEPRLLPFNSTTLTVAPTIAVRGGTATIGNAFANLNFGGTLLADVDGEELAIGAGNWNATQSMQATNNGSIRFFGALDNGDAGLSLDTAGGALSITSGTTITDITLNGTPGTDMQIPGGTYTFTDVIANLDMTLANSALVNVTNGMTMNGTALINAPASPTGFQFTNTQTLAGTGTFEINGSGNGVISEPRLFPFNSTTLTVASTVTVRGGTGTIGNPFAGLVFNGNLISDQNGEALRIGGSPWSANQALTANAGGELQFFGTHENGGAAFTLDAVGTVTTVESGTTLRAVTINGSAGTRLDFTGGTTTLDNTIINADMVYRNTAISNVSNGLTLNGTATIEAPTSPTGMQFNNSMSLLGNANIVFDSAANGVISEPRLLPLNATTLTIGPNVSISGSTATIGNPFAGLIMNGSIDANVVDEPIQITGSPWSGTGSISANNGGEIRLAGLLDNADATLSLDTGDGTLSVVVGANLRNANLNGASGTNLVFAAGSTTLANLIVTADMTLNNGAVAQITDGLTLNGTALIDAPTQPTGMQFNNTMTLDGSGTVIFDGVGNSQISEPRLLPANSTVLTIDSGITVRGGKGRVGNAFASVIVNGTISADVEEIEVVGGTVTNNGLLEALNGVTLDVDNIVAGPGGELHAGAGSTIELRDGYAMLASSVTSIDIDDPLGTGPGIITSTGTVSYDGTANISAVNGFMPLLGASFPLITHSDFAGAFSSVNSSGLGGGQSFGVTYAMGASTATVQ